MEFKDNSTYRYLDDQESNECQSATFIFGPPSFLSIETAVPTAPEWRDATCDVAAAVWIPETDGVVYAISGIEVQPGEHAIVSPQSVTVTASPGENYEFAEGVTAEWSHQFAAPECTEEPPVLPDTGLEDSGAAPPAKPVAEAQLANSGSEMAPFLQLGGAAVVALGVGLIALVRVRSVSRR